MSFMQTVERRWGERKLGLEPVTVTASTHVAAKAERVWALLMAPELSTLVDPSVVRAFRVPGTPVGEVGEQQCFITDAGNDRRSVTLMEIAKVEPPVRVVVRCSTSPTAFVVTYTLVPDEAGLSLSCQWDALVEKGYRRKAEPTLRDECQKQINQIAAAIRSGFTIPDM